MRKSSYSEIQDKPQLLYNDINDIFDNPLLNQFRMEYISRKLNLFKYRLQPKYSTNIKIDNFRL